jgi:hypothetical protein
MRGLIAAAVIMLAVFGCGGSSRAKIPTKTTTALSTMSPDGQLAVNECEDALNPPTFVLLPLQAGASPARLNEAIRACSNALDHTTAELGKDSPLAVNLAAINSVLADLNSAYLNGESLADCSPAYKAYITDIHPLWRDLRKETNPPENPPKGTRTTVASAPICTTTTPPPPKRTAPTLAKTSSPTSNG